MTYLEKLKKEHPEWHGMIKQDFNECPGDYGYVMAKELCLCEPATDDICRRCWNQEAGGTK